MSSVPDDVVSKSAVRRYVRDVCPNDYVEELLDVVRDYTQDDLPFYSDSLRRAFEIVEPVFARTRYGEFFWHCSSTVPRWLQRVVLANSVAESEGSGKLLELWQGIDYNPDVEQQVFKHAHDESRHARIFLHLTASAFPSFATAEDLEHLDQTLPDIRARKHPKSAERLPENHLIDHLIQMNIGEIRTRLHMHLLAPIIFEFSPESSKVTVRRLLEGLVRDEVRHIGYTANLMEQWAQDGAGDLIQDLYERRLATFNEITVMQTEDAVRDYGQGRFPDLLDL